VHADEMGEHDLSIERVSILNAGVFDDSVRNRFSLVAGDVVPAARAPLAVGHCWTSDPVGAELPAPPKPEVVYRPGLATELGGTVPLWEWIGDGATRFSY
jgi:hypothetical protein